tara:strand:+ start:184 stop:450 length:267 start_codon:yes stop_codon:yes gene_type:complete
MIKELKYLFYILIILLISFFTLKYYFSNEYKKKSYRSIKLIDKKIQNFSTKLILLENDTNNVIEYTEKTVNKNEKNFNFWNLIRNNEK